MEQTYFIRPHYAGFWEVVCDSPAIPVRAYATQQQALQRVRMLARNHLPCSIVLLDLDGDIRVEYDYRADHSVVANQPRHNERNVPKERFTS
jgi:hypothetical protein